MNEKKNNLHLDCFRSSHWEREKLQRRLAVSTDISNTINYTCWNHITHSLLFLQSLALGGLHSLNFILQLHRRILPSTYRPCEKINRNANAWPSTREWKKKIHSTALAIDRAETNTILLSAYTLMFNEETVIYKLLCCFLTDHKPCTQ